METKESDYKSYLVAEVLEELEEMQLLETEGRKAGKWVLRFGSREREAEKRLSVVVKKCPSPDAKINKYWKDKIMRTFNLNSFLTHDNIVQVQQYFLKQPDELTCQILKEDAGKPLSIFPTEKTSKIVRTLVDQSLAAFAYLENRGLAYIGATTESILFSPATGVFKLDLSSADRVLPRWALHDNYCSLKKIKSPYLAPELDPHFDLTQDCVGDVFQGIDMCRQDVYSWGMIMYKFVTGFPCLTKPKPEEYNSFINELNRITFKDDVKGEVSKVVRSLVKAALSPDPNHRPSFVALREMSRRADMYTEEQILLLLQNRCACCGHLREGGDCSLCTTIQSCYKDPLQIDKIVEEDPYAVLGQIHKLGPTKQAIFNVVQQVVKTAKRVSDELHVECLVHAIKISLEYQNDEHAMEYIDQIIAAEDRAQGADPVLFMKLNAVIASWILPYAMEVLPNFLTIPPPFKTAAWKTEEDYEQSFNPCLDKLMKKGPEIVRERDSSTIHPYINFLFHEQILRCMRTCTPRDVAEKPKVFDEHIDTLKRIAYDFAVKAGSEPIDKIMHLCMAERLLRVSIETKRYLLAKDMIETIKGLMERYYTENDVKEYTTAFEATLSFAQSDHDNAEFHISNYMKHPRRPKNVASLVLMTSCAGSVSLYEKKDEQACEYYKKLLGTEGIENFPRILEAVAEVYLKKCRTCIDRQDYDELFSYAEEACEACKSRSGSDPAKLAEALLYYSVALWVCGDDVQSDLKLIEAYRLVKTTEFDNYLVKAMVMFERGNRLFKKGNKKEALSCLEVAFEACGDGKLITHKSGLASRILNNLGNVERVLRMKDQASGHYETAVNIAINSCGKDSIEFVRPLANMGSLMIEFDIAAETGVLHINTAKTILIRNGMEGSELYKDFMEIVEKSIKLMKNRRNEQMPVNMLIPFIGGDNYFPFNAVAVRKVYTEEVNTDTELSPELASFRDAILEVKCTYDESTFTDWLMFLSGVIKRALEAALKGVKPFVLSMTTEECRPTAEFAAATTIVTSILGFDDKGDSLVMQNPDQDTLRTAFKIIVALVESSRVLFATLRQLIYTQFTNEFTYDQLT